MKFKPGDIVRPIHMTVEGVVQKVDESINGVYVKFKEAIRCYNQDNPHEIFEATEGWAAADELTLVASSEWEDIWGFGEE